MIKNHRLTAKDLQQDLVAAGSEISGSTKRCILNTEGLHVQTPGGAPLPTQKQKKSWLQFAQNSINKPKRFGDSVL